MRRLRSRYHYRRGLWYCTLVLPARQAEGAGRTKSEAYAAAYRELYGSPVRLHNPAPVKLYS